MFHGVDVEQFLLLLLKKENTNQVETDLFYVKRSQFLGLSCAVEEWIGEERTASGKDQQGSGDKGLLLPLTRVLASALLGL